MPDPAVGRKLVSTRKKGKMPADETLVGEIVADCQPLTLRCAVRSLGACVLRTVALLTQHAISQPTDRVGQVLRFADGSGDGSTERRS